MRMLNALIVDDEAFVVEWVASLLEAQSDLNLQIFTAYGYAEAAAVLDRHRIDLLISDIRMPDGSGLDLTLAAQARFPECRTLLLTAYADFEAAHQAIRNDVDGYILKTETDEAILRSVRRAIDKAERELDRRQLQTATERDCSRYQTLLKHQTTLCWLHGSFIRPQQLRECMALLGFAPQDRCSLLVCRLPGAAKLAAEDLDARLSRVRAVTEAQLEAILNRWSAERVGDGLVFLLAPAQGCSAHFASLAEGLLEMAVQTCLTACGAVVSFALSAPCEDPGEVPGLYFLAQHALGQASERDGGFVYRLSAPPCAQPEAQAPLTGPLRSMEEMLDSGDRAGYFQALPPLIERFAHAQTWDDEKAMSAYCAAALPLMSHMLRHGMTESLREPLGLDAFYAPAGQGSWMRAGQYLRHVATLLFQLREQERTGDKQALIDAIDAYILRHIHEDITLPALSAEFCYNASYLSRFYSENTGVTLKKAIVRQKMKLIDRLMLDPDLSLSEVAERAGFHSRTYFNAYFKRVCNATPSQYREALVGQAQRGR